MSDSVDLAAEVVVALQRMRERDDVPLRCNKGPIRAAVAAAVHALVADDLGARVRPWDLSALRRVAVGLGPVDGAIVLSVDDGVLIAELRPDGRRIALRGVDDSWRLVRFLSASERPEAVRLPSESCREIALDRFSVEGVLAALGIDKPDDVELDVESAKLGHGETETRYRYLFTDRGRSVQAEEVTCELDDAPPSSRRVRGVLIDNGRGALLTGSRDRAVLIQG
ncbi:hypothetical protein ACTJJE_16215 [Mycolicibacterium sp. 22603]|uniref:hypothetical protein n=1 Tax=Mycolicibacterium sp. 22603 TaxID=3453950 RepID=UPI003F866C67